MKAPPILLDALGALAQLPSEVEQLRARVAELETLVKTLSRPANDDDWVSIAEAAELRGCTVDAMNKRVQRGSIPATRIGRSVRIRRRDALGGER
jgi:excisionase family DNA binding protein